MATLGGIIRGTAITLGVMYTVGPVFNTVAAGGTWGEGAIDIFKTLGADVMNIANVGLDSIS